MFYDTLFIRRGICPEGCSLCVDACAARHEGLALLKIVRTTKNNRLVSTCKQCSEPACAAACPSEAINKTGTGVVKVEEDLCTGCGLCVEACVHEGILLDERAGVAKKCDYCGGQPACAEACPYGVISLARGATVASLEKENDLLSPGLPACAGCPVETAVRFTLRVLGRNTIFFAGPGCCPLPGRSYSATYGCLMTNVASSMTGMQRYLKKIGSDAQCVAFVGDGLSADVGFQPLSAAAERGENLIYICYDNEAYMNTGIQRSSTTPAFAWTTTTPVGSEGRGKKREPKNLPLLMYAHGIPYVATATVSHLQDYGQKLLRAQEAAKEGLAYIHLLTPCPTGWRFEIDQGIEICRKAVETNYFPLWEASRGVLSFTHKEPKPQPVSSFTSAMGRFKHLNTEEIAQLQAMVNKRYAFLEMLAAGTAK